MFWLIVGATSTGILLGLWLRVSSVLAASLLVVVASVALVPLLTDWSLLTAVAFVFVLLAALQFGYLAGALITVGQTRTRSPADTGLPRTTSDRVEPRHRTERDEAGNHYERLFLRRIGAADRENGLAQ